MSHTLDLIHLLKNAASCCERELQVGLQGSDISICQAMMLQQIQENGESMSKLSKALCCHKSNVTQIVDGMVKAEWVERELCKTDRRVSHLKLTGKGKKLLDVIEAALKKQADKCFGMYSDTEKKQLEGLLKKFVETHSH